MANLKKTPKTNPLQRHHLGQQLKEAGALADAEAELLRGWLEDADNMNSLYYVTAAALYERYTEARKAYWAYRDTGTTRALAQLRIAENQLDALIASLREKQRKREAMLN